MHTYIKFSSNNHKIISKKKGLCSLILYFFPTSVSSSQLFEGSLILALVPVLFSPPSLNNRRPLTSFFQSSIDAHNNSTIISNKNIHSFTLFFYFLHILSLKLFLLLPTFFYSLKTRVFFPFTSNPNLLLFDCACSRSLPIKNDQINDDYVHHQNTTTTTKTTISTGFSSFIFSHTRQRRLSSASPKIQQPKGPDRSVVFVVSLFFFFKFLLFLLRVFLLTEKRFVAALGAALWPSTI